MKASFRFIIAALAVTAALAGCTKEITPPSFENDKVAPATEGSRVIAVSFAPQTKTYLDKGGFQPKFNDEDSILISNGEALDTCAVDVNGDNATISTSLTGPLTAVYPYKAAKMNESNLNRVDTVLVSTFQSGTFADANICMARMKGGKDESLSFENKTAVFCIYPPTDNLEYVEVSADGFEIANDVPTGSTHTSLETIHVNTTTADSVYVSILVPDGLKVSDLTFSDGTNEKTVTGDKAATEIAAGTLYTVTKENWKSPEADTPDGALKGVFTVGKGTDGKAGTADDIKVHFSQGNLRYIVGTKEWGFYEHQYDFCNTTTYPGHHSDTVSLFTWGYNENKSTEPDGDDSDNISRYNGSLAQTEDWGYVFGGESSVWRTLSTDEWVYLINKNGDETIRKGKYKYGVTVCGKANCLILAPDDFEEIIAASYDATAWATAEAAGLVCLPAAGVRYGSFVFSDGGNYWSSTACDSYNAYLVFFDSGGVLPGNSTGRNYGNSVRLITDVSAAPAPTPGKKEIVLWEGEVVVDDWANQPYLLSDAGLELKDANATVGQEVRFYITAIDDNWKLKIHEGHWVSEYCSYCSVGNDTEGGSYIEYDLDANGGYISLTLTQAMLDAAFMQQYWGGTFIANGDNVKITKITLY